MMSILYGFSHSVPLYSAAQTDRDLSAEHQQFTQQIGHFVCLIPLDRQSSFSAVSILSTAFL